MRASSARTTSVETTCSSRTMIELPAPKRGGFWHRRRTSETWSARVVGSSRTFVPAEVASAHRRKERRRHADRGKRAFSGSRSGSVVFFVGVLITERVEFLRRHSIPELVTGGFVASSRR
jgi:hypothetical protein